MIIKTEEIKKIREETGAGVMECKRALEKSEGDYQVALNFLKEQGLLLVKKKENRTANEGKIFIKTTKEKAGLIYLACETDFVARNGEFIKLGKACLDNFFEQGFADNNPQITLILNEAVAKIKENIFLKNYKIIEASENEILKTYSHNDGRIGAILKIRVDTEMDSIGSDFENFINDLVLHIAAFAPLFIDRKDIPSVYITEQLQKFTEETLALNKPEKIMAGIIRGKLEKHLKSICLMDQPFIRDDKLSTIEVIRETAVKSNIRFHVTDFYYCRVGE